MGSTLGDHSLRMSVNCCVNSGIGCMHSPETCFMVIARLEWGKWIRPKGKHDLVIVFVPIVFVSVVSEFIPTMATIVTIPTQSDQESLITNNTLAIAQVMRCLGKAAAICAYIIGISQNGL